MTPCLPLGYCTPTDFKQFSLCDSLRSVNRFLCEYMEYGMEIAFYAETLLDKYIMLKLFYNGMLLNNASAKQTF